MCKYMMDGTTSLFRGPITSPKFSISPFPPTTRTTDGEGGGDAYLIAGSYLPLLPDHFDEEAHTIDNLLEKASTLNVRTSHREAVDILPHLPFPEA